MHGSYASRLVQYDEGIPVFLLWFVMGPEDPGAMTRCTASDVQAIYRCVVLNLSRTISPSDPPTWLS